MPKRKPKFDEASLTTGIKGYIAGRILDPYEHLRKKEKKKDVPWYLKRNDDLEQMVRRSLGESKFEACINVLLEAKMPGLTLGKLPPELRSSIFKLVKGPRKVSDNWRRWEALPDELRKKIELWYAKNKEKFVEPEKSPSARIDPSLRKAKISRVAIGKKPEKKAERPGPEEKLPAKVPGGKITTSADEYLKTLHRNLKQAKKRISLNPDDQTPKDHAKFIVKQIKLVKKAVEQGEDFRKYIQPPSVKARPPEKREFRQGDDALVRQVSNLIPPGLRQKTNVGPRSKEAHDVGVHRLRQFAGLSPTSEQEHTRISGWVRDVLIGRFDGDLDKWAVAQPAPPKPRRVAPPEEKMKIKVGKKAAPTAPTKKARFRGEPMPGAKPSMMKLHRAMEQDPEHAKIPFAPEPKMARSQRGFEPGAVGRILQKIYGELATEYLYGRGGRFDDLVQSVNKRHPEVDLNTVLQKYTQISQDEEAMNRLPQLFSKEELRALMELSDLSDPETLQAIKHDDMTRFEKTLGPYLRKVYAKKGYTVDPEVGYSKAMTMQLSRQFGVPLQNVEELMKDKSPEERAEIEQGALEQLKRISPDVYAQEMRMREKREEAQAEIEVREKTQADVASDIQFKRREPDPEREEEFKKELSLLRQEFKEAEDEDERKELKEKYEETYERYREMIKHMSFSQFVSPERIEAVERQRHLIPRGGGLSKAERRARSRAEISRDPEELAFQKSLTREYPRGLMRKPKPRVFKSVEEYEKEQKKKKLIDLIKQSREKQMAANESFKFSIADLYEGFENSWDLDVSAKEEEWEEAKLPAQKNWTKDLTLESLVAQIMEK